MMKIRKFLQNCRNFLLFLNEMRKFLQNCSFYKHLAGNLHPFGNNYCTIAGIWFQTRKIEAKTAETQVFTLGAH
jgi:hypothetical protein